MENNKNKVDSVVATPTPTERTISISRKMLDEIGEKPKLASIMSRLIEQSDAGTTGKTIFTMAKMLEKQTEMEVK